MATAQAVPAPLFDKGRTWRAQRRLFEAAGRWAESPSRSGRGLDAPARAAQRNRRLRRQWPLPRQNVKSTAGADAWIPSAASGRPFPCHRQTACSPQSMPLRCGRLGRGLSNRSRSDAPGGRDPPPFFFSLIAKLPLRCVSGSAFFRAQAHGRRGILACSWRASWPGCGRCGCFYLNAGCGFALR